MTPKTEATFAIVAALLVLFSAMISPPVSAGVAVLCLLAIAAYKLFQRA